MKIWQAVLFLCLIWAMIYLTHLGDRELRGEEARRIIPAQEMLETGDWIVPKIAGEVYSNKPPLINWLIATSFTATGTQSEFTARLPSVLSLLLLGLSAFLLFRDSLGVERATYIGLVLFTSFAMIDKCRMAEIEPVFITLFGLACFFWIRFWTSGASPWLTWTVPYLFLGIGWLAKGPVHLLFWALFLGFTLFFSRRSKELLHPAHGVGIGLMLLLFLPWMTSNIEAVGSADESMGTWIEQLAMRADFSNIDYGEWLAHPFEILVNFLPWTVPLSFALWQRRKGRVRWDRQSRSDAVVRGALYATLAGCIFICLLPGGLPRYIMPLYPLAAFALVEVYGRMRDEDRERYERFAGRALRFVILLVLVITTAGCVYAIQRSIAIDWLTLLPAAGLLVGTFFWFRKHGGSHSYFLSASFVFAAGVMALVCSIVPHQVASGTMRPAARELLEQASREDRKVVVFADEIFRSAFTRELRLLFYLRPEMTAVGENGDLPQERILVLGRPHLERALRNRKRNFEISNRETITLDGRDLSLLTMDPKE